LNINSSKPNFVVTTLSTATGFFVYGCL